MYVCMHAVRIMYVCMYVFLYVLVYGSPDVLPNHCEITDLSDLCVCICIYVRVHVCMYDHYGI
jgi:hypothetical protein